MSDLSPHPTELIPFQPVDGADTRYGQIYKSISAHPFKIAGIKGFTPIQPFKVAKDILAQTNQCTAFHWPSLSELNDDIVPFPWTDDSEYERYMAGDFISRIPVLMTGPPSAAPNHPIPSHPFPQFICSRLPLSGVRIACFLSPTVLVPMMHKNGVSLGFHSMILSLFTHLACWTAASCLSFTLAILPIGTTSQSTSIIGSNFMVGRIFFIRR